MSELCQYGNAFSDAQAQVLQGRLDASQIDDIKNARNPAQVAFDLYALVQLYQRHWETLSGKTTLAAEDVQNAESVASELLMQLGDLKGDVVDESSDLRQRAFTFFMNSYGQIKRLITYVRWEEGDAEKIAPSLYRGRKNSRARAKRKEDNVAASGSDTSSPAASEPVAQPETEDSVIVSTTE